MIIITIAIIDKIPFIATKAADSYLIAGSENKPAIIETTPMIIVISLGKFTELKPFERVARLFTFASRINAKPIIIIKRLSI